MSNKKIIPISFDIPNIIVKEESRADLPFLSSFIGDGIVLRKDYIRKVATIRSSVSTREVYKVNIYYNVLLSLFDVDEVEVCAYTNMGEERVVKNFILEEKLSPRDQEIISYLRKAIKYAEDNEDAFRKNILQPNQSPALTRATFPGENRRNNFVRKVLSYLFRDTREEDLKSTFWRTQSLKEKFPEVNLHAGKIYLYSHSVFSSDSVPGDSTRLMPLPVNSDFESIQKKSYMSGDFKEGLKIFQDECYKIISEGKDPLKVFIESNLLFNRQSGNSFKPIGDSEARLLSAFLRQADIKNGHFIGFRNPIRFPESDIYTATAISNLKKISFDFSMPSEFKPRSLEIKLIKNFQGKKEKFSVTSTGVEYDHSFKFFKTQRMNNLGSFPVQYKFRSNPNKKTVSIEKEQFHDPSIRTYNCHRIVSRSKLLNSAFVIKDTNTKLSTEIILDETGNVTLNREIILNTNSGEFLVNSTVLDKENFEININKPAKAEERISEINLISFCVSKSSNNSPVNILKVVNSTDDVRIGKVICTPELNSTSFSIPFKRRDKEIVHANPLPGMRYKYEVTLIDGRGFVHENILTTKILTLPQAPLNLTLVPESEVVSGDGKKSLRISLPRSGLTNFASAISSTLDKIFTQKERDFYNEDFKNNLRSNLQRIGQNFELYVSYISHEDGEMLEKVTNSYGISNEESTDEEFVFLVPVNVGYEKYEIQYNLILTNPIDLSEVEEKIQDPDSKKFFNRATSKFFSTVASINGTIPVAVAEQNTGDTLFQSNNRYPPNSNFSRMVCLGGYTTVDNSMGFMRHRVSSAKAFYNVDDGDFIIRWKVFYRNPGFRKKTSIEFFIITIVMQGVEIPLTAYPFIGYTDYQLRTQSIFGMAKAVKFKIYPVYHDYTIDLSNVVETEEYQTDDIRSKGVVIVS